MQFTVDLAFAILARTPEVLATLLHDLPAEWTQENEGEDTWSPFDVVGHLIHGERTDWITRASIIREHGDARPFDPFDRFAQFEESRGKTMEQLLREFRDARQGSLAALMDFDLSEESLDKRGVHPELGSVTLRELLSTWVVHDLGHIAQIVRTMAKQYGDNVGPWREYLPVLSDRNPSAELEPPESS